MPMKLRLRKPNLFREACEWSGAKLVPDKATLYDHRTLCSMQVQSLESNTITSVDTRHPLACGRVKGNDIQIYKRLKHLCGKMLTSFQGSRFIKPIFRKPQCIHKSSCTSVRANLVTNESGGFNIDRTLFFFPTVF